MIAGRKYNFIAALVYATLLALGAAALFHGFPDIERFFAEWMDERMTLTVIMKFGTLNFAPTQIMHPPLYHYLTFMPIAFFFIVGKVTGFFYDKAEFVRFYFNNTHYFFFIGRMMSYAFYWSAAAVMFKIVRLFYNRLTAHLAVAAYLLIPRLIFDYSTTRADTLLFLNVSLFFYFFIRYYLDKSSKKWLLLSAFFLGTSTATKYNAIYLGVMFIPLLLIQAKDIGNGGVRSPLTLWASAAFLTFLGFFMCNPFFILQFGKYFHNLMIYGVEMKYYWKGNYLALFGSVHLAELVSFIYLNPVGFLILILGTVGLFRADKKLFTITMLAVLVYEVFFGLLFKNYSPLRYLNPLMPVAVLLFGAGIDQILKRGRKAAAVLIIFYLVLSYNYLDIWKGMLGPTHIKQARAFIERTVPEFSAICITSCNYIPQLSMTPQSYERLIKIPPPSIVITGHELDYKEFDKSDDYDSVFRKIRIESLATTPQYNIVKWDDNIKDEKEAALFLKKNGIQYIVSQYPVVVSGKKIEDTGIAIFFKKFPPSNKRIYRAVYADTAVFLYKVN